MRAKAPSLISTIQFRQALRIDLPEFPFTKAAGLIANHTAIVRQIDMQYPDRVTASPRYPWGAMRWWFV